DQVFRTVAGTDSAQAIFEMEQDVEQLVGVDGRGIAGTGCSGRKRAGGSDRQGMLRPQVTGESTGQGLARQASYVGSEPGHGRAVDLELDASERDTFGGTQQQHSLVNLQRPALGEQREVPIGELELDWRAGRAVQQSRERRREILAQTEHSSDRGFRQYLE